ncbi:Homeodomain-like protein, partial [Syncephalis pseudoplumigaleata]
ARGERVPWLPEEDNLLRLAVQLYGYNTDKWTKISACVPGRTNKHCRKRWFHSLDPSRRRGSWTSKEDLLLREAHARFGEQWSRVAELVPGRTDDQCSKRWRESLDPAIDRSEWTEAEDQDLLRLVGELGSQWQRIAEHFPGRPGLHCRNRWRKLCRSI